MSKSVALRSGVGFWNRPLPVGLAGKKLAALAAANESGRSGAIPSCGQARQIATSPARDAILVHIAAAGTATVLAIAPAIVLSTVPAVLPGPYGRGDYGGLVEGLGLASTGVCPARLHAECGAELYVFSVADLDAKPGSEMAWE